MHERRRSRVTVRGFGLGRAARAASGGEPDTAANVRSVAIAIAVAAALFVVFNSSELRKSVRDLPGNAVTDLMVAGADRWHALMLDVGPARVRPWVREALSVVRSVRW